MSVEKLNPLTIAVVEDDIDLLANTLDYLKSDGFDAWGSTSAEAFYKQFAVRTAHIIILDISLPGENGLSMVEHLKHLNNIVLIIVSARAAIDDRLAGMNAGADRYLVKPVNFKELVANIEAAARNLQLSRHEAWTEPNEKNHLMLIQPVELATELKRWTLIRQDQRLVSPKGDFILLTSREYLFICLLFEAKNQTVLKINISNKLFGSKISNGFERLDVLLARLRKKGIDQIACQLPIMTVHQMGYSFTETLELI